jgi:tetratricopeptide (TPR) repeat protein
VLSPESVEERVHRRLITGYLTIGNNWAALDELEKFRGALPEREIREASARAMDQGSYEEAIAFARTIDDFETIREVGHRARRDGRDLVAISAYHIARDVAALGDIAYELSASTNGYFLMLADMAYRDAGIEPPVEFIERLAEDQLRTHPDAKSASATYARAGRRPSADLAREIAAERLAGDNIAGAIGVYELAGVPPDPELLIAAGERLHRSGELHEAAIAFQAAGAQNRAVKVANELLLTNPYAVRIAVDILANAHAMDRVVAAAQTAYERGEHDRVRAIFSAAGDAERLAEYGDSLLDRGERAEATIYYEEAERLRGKVA